MVDLDGKRSTTLREMEDLICRVTAKIEARGFERGSFLLIRMSRRMEYVAVYYGAIQAGMAVVPTVLDYPEDRISYIIENCHSPFSITDDFMYDLSDYTPSRGPQLHSDDIVCMNYTSGSTGKPKGVYYSLRCVSENIRRAGLLFAGLAGGTGRSPRILHHTAGDREGSGCETEVIFVRFRSSVRAWRERAEAQDSTVLEQLCAAGLRAIGRYNGSTKTVVNWIYSGRDMKIKQHMAGLLISAMPVPADLSKFSNKEDLLKEVRRINRKNLSYSDLSPGLDGGRPVYDDTLTVNYNPYEDADRGWAEGVTVHSLLESNSANSNAFYVIVLEESPEEEPKLMFKYNRAMYNRPQMERFVRIYMEELGLGEFELKE